MKREGRGLRGREEEGERRRDLGKEKGDRVRMRRAVVVKGRGRRWMKSKSLLVKLGRRFYRVPHPPQQGIPRHWLAGTLGSP